MQYSIHIVSFDVPWPVDYGGMFDIMNTIIEFKKMNVDVYLHCFLYNERGKPKELNKYCKEVFYYQRKSFAQSFSFKTPYIVSSRLNHELIERLNQNSFPVLIQGIHCTGIIPYLRKDKKICVRMHNEEYIYYSELAKQSGNLLKKIYYKWESVLLHQYYKHLNKNISISCLSKIDIPHFEKLGFKNIHYTPILINWQSINSNTDKGCMCFFHGNLSIAENENAAIWLLTSVFSKLKIPFAIAGKNPTNKLLKNAGLCVHTCLIANPTEKELNDLIQKAQVNVLPLFNTNSTGIRLKLLHALFEGKHCLVSRTMVEGSELMPLCHIADRKKDFEQKISHLYQTPFTEKEKELRKEVLLKIYNNEKNAKQLLDCLV
ncbi:MAG: glycosyltransferase [Chitinophagaceae bacterium]|nr:MAG: glycosyltransferase [Chitinophagaceae bacterium]